MKKTKLIEIVAQAWNKHPHSEKEMDASLAITIIDDIWEELEKEQAQKHTS